MYYTIKDYRLEITDKINKHDTELIGYWQYVY